MRDKFRAMLKERFDQNASNLVAPGIVEERGDYVVPMDNITQEKMEHELLNRKRRMNFLAKEGALIAAGERIQ